MKNILHIDFNSFFATVEQQANPRLRGKPIGVTGGDRMKRTVVGAASVEAKRFGVKTGMQIWEALKLCPNLILVQGDSDKYLEVTKRFLNILKDYSPNLEIFSIDEVFLEVEDNTDVLTLAQEIKDRIKSEVGDYITCSIGISYNKLMAKLAGSLYKPDGLVAILDPQAAQFILDRVELDEICGIGRQIKKRLLNMGITNFQNLRLASRESLIASFKSYGEVLYNMSRGIDNNPVIPFFEKEEVKSIGHRHTISHDTSDLNEIKQTLLKMSEMVGKRARDKKLVGKTIHVFFRYSFEFPYTKFEGDGMQVTIQYTQDGLEIFNAGFEAFLKLWNGKKVRMIGLSLSNLKPILPQTISLLPETYKKETILKVLDKINNKFGEFTLQRGILLNSQKIKRKANPFLADRRFRI